MLSASVRRMSKWIRLTLSPASTSSIIFPTKSSTKREKLLFRHVPSWERQLGWQRLGRFLGHIHCFDFIGALDINSVQWSRLMSKKTSGALLHFMIDNVFVALPEEPVPESTIHQGNHFFHYLFKWVSNDIDTSWRRSGESSGNEEWQLIASGEDGVIHRFGDTVSIHAWSEC